MISLSEIPLKQTPNIYKDRINKPEYIIIHAACGSYAGTVSWLTNPNSEVSAHFVISKKGEITRLAKDNQSAWHCWGLNTKSVGIEHEDATFIKNPKTGKFFKVKDCTNDGKWVTQELLDTSAQLVALLMKKHSISLDKVVGHDSLWIRKLNPKFAHQDPGVWWPWETYFGLIKKYLKEVK